MTSATTCLSPRQCSARRAEVLAKAAQLHLAESALNAPAAEFGGVEFYPDFSKKAAVLCARLVKNHALPDGNKRTAYICLREFVERNGHSWFAPQEDPDETVRVIEGIAAGDVSEDEFAGWVAERN